MHIHGLHWRIHKLTTLREILAHASCGKMNRNRKGVAKVVPVPLDGLGVQWEGSETVRRRILWDGQLLKWMKAELIGVPSYKAAALNIEALQPFFTAWVAMSPRPASPKIPWLKKQARVHYSLHCTLRFLEAVYFPNPFMPLTGR